MSVEFGADEIRVDGLDRIIKALKAPPPVARVGILGSRGMRKGGSSGNAEIGAVHEFGSLSRGIPIRSFLRVPISDNLRKRMEAVGATDEDHLKQVIAEKSVVPWMRKVAVLAEGIVKEAFDTGGFGKWAPWKSPDYTNNANMILVDTGQLRDSITHEVKER